MSKIKEVRTHLILIERKKEILPKTSHGSTTHNEYVIIEIATESGVVGAGEVTAAVGWNGEEGVGSADLLIRKIGPAITGLEVSDWQAISKAIEQWTRHRPFLKAAVEMACLDAEGKEKDKSISDIFGGALRTRFETKLVLPAREAEVVRGMAQIAKDRGGKAFKVKVGLDISADRARLAAVREVIGDEPPLLVDANEGWRPDEEREIIDLIEQFNIASVEQPYPRRFVEESAHLQANTSALLMADESVWTLDHVRRIAQSQSFAVVSLYPGKQGGLRSCLESAQLATELGLGVSLGSNLETGVGSAFMAHFLALAPVIAPEVPGDLLGPLYFVDDVTTGTPWITWTGVTLPTGPGLGIELDQELLAKHKISVTV
ncbi:MAG: mandelate racemase/muconate lactonizing enzyme family protein [Rhodoluna sp.]